MAVNKNFVVKNGLEVSTDLILADANRNKVGIGSTTPRTELDVRGGIAATDISISGVGTIVTLQSNTGTVTNLSSTNLVAGVGTVGAVQATYITASGVATAATLNVTGTGTIAVGVVTYLSGTNLNYSGIATANSISIGATQVISNERQLQNIVSLDATTTSTIEAAIANAPNTFTDLRVTGFSTLNAVSVGDITLAGIATGLNVPGVGTIANLRSTNINATGITTLGITTVSQLSSAGIVTASSFVPTSGYIKAPDGTNSFFIYSTSGNVAFQGTIGASQLNSASGNKVIGLAGSDATFTRNVSIPGITTLGSIVVGSGIVTASTGIVTYYGDGRYLQNVISGVGIGSTGGVVGYGVTFINFYGAGVSTAYYSATTGIATVYFQGGGGGATVSIGTAAPVSPTSGDLWYNNEIGRTFIYYDEVYLGIGSAQVWVDAAPFNIGVLNPVSIALSTGTFSSPSLYFSSDSDTGLFQPTPNQQTFVAAGASVLNINPGGINVTGVVTATSFRGDGSNLTNLPAGLGTALSSDQTSPLNKIYYTDQVLSIGSTVTVDPPSTAKVAYTQYAEIQVDGDADLIIADGDEFIPNILGIGTTGSVGTIGGGGRVRADNFSNRSGTGAPTFNAGVNVTGVVTATTFDGNATTATTATTANSLSTNATGTNLTLSGNLTVNGTQTIINSQTLDVADKTIGIGSTSTPSDALADGAGIVIYGTTNKTLTWQDNSDAFTFSEGIDIKGAVETVSTGSTYDLGGGRVVLECDAKNGTVFTHNLSNGNVGIVSLRNFPATKNSVTTFTIFFTQASTAPTGGIGNTTIGTGIGTNITLAPLGVAGFTTSARVATASTVTLSTTANDIDIVTLAIHYNGSGTGTVGNYRVFATGNTGFRFGTVGF